MKKTSIKDIAKSLGVSPTLVSLVLNGKGDQNGISPVTQKKVSNKAIELNYKPNITARSLRIGKTDSIGLIVSDISNPFYAKIAGRIERKASDAGYNLIVCSTYEDSDKEVELIRMLMSRNADGIIISSSSETGKEINELKKENYPFVLIDRKLPISDVNFVSVDNELGAYLATKHLIEKAYRSIALLLISPSYISTVKERKSGYIKAITEAELEVDPNLIREIKFDQIQKDTESVIRDLFLNNKKIDAVFTSNNSINTACLRVFSENKISVPKDLALISFDDIDWFEFSNPKISAVAQPLNEIGDFAFDILLKEMGKNEKNEKKQICLKPNLIIREST